MTPAADPLPVIDERLMTGDEFIAKYGHLGGVELVRGRVVWKGQSVPPTGGPVMPKFRHGVTGYRATKVFSDFVEAHRLGWLAINDTFVPVGGEPPSVRGADLLYVSYARLPATAEPPEDLLIPPDLVVAVRSPSDRRGDMMMKIGESMNAGVRAVVVIDPRSRTVDVYRLDETDERFQTDDEFTLPDVLPGFTVPVRRFFETA